MEVESLGGVGWGIAYADPSDEKFFLQKNKCAH